MLVLECHVGGVYVCFKGLSLSKEGRLQRIFARDENPCRALPYYPIGLTETNGERRSLKYPGSEPHKMS